MDIDNILQSQKDYFLSQQTKDISFRKKCLKKLQTELIKRESDIIKALHDDFKKSEYEAVLTETSIVLSELLPPVATPLVITLQYLLKEGNLLIPLLNYISGSLHLEKIDSLGIVKRGYDKSIGQKFYPAIILDGHISWMGLSFLKYINDKDNQ